ncbi:VanZ family protein [Nitrospira sp. T9]|uniref:VanZ family protein n=2 Tax=unclassified Nitrospira TaxID=2652172 RepID=UPI003F966C8A
MTDQKFNQGSMVSRFLVPGLVLVLLGLLALPWIPVPSDTRLWKALNDFGHVPLYGGVAIILLFLARQFGEPRGWSLVAQYTIAVIGVVLLGVVSEGIQVWMPSRHSELADFLRDVVGAVCALGIFLTLDRHLVGKWVVWQQAPRKHLVYAGVGLLIVIVLIPVLTWSYAYWDRTARFPSLCQFSSVWEMMFVQATDSELRIVPPPVGWDKSRNDTVGHVMFYPEKYPGIRIDEPYPDWRGFSHFRVEVYSELPVAQSLTIRIEDAHRNHGYADRFNRVITITPGLNHIHILLDDIRHAPLGRELDLSAISNVMLFAIRPPEEFSLYVDDIRLE